MARVILLALALLVGCTNTCKCEPGKTVVKAVAQDAGLFQHWCLKACATRMTQCGPVGE